MTYDSDYTWAVEKIVSELAAITEYNTNAMLFGTDLFPETDDLDKMKELNNLLRSTWGIKDGVIEEGKSMNNTQELSLEVVTDLLYNRLASVYGKERFPNESSPEVRAKICWDHIFEGEENGSWDRDVLLKMYWKEFLQLESAVDDPMIPVINLYPEWKSKNPPGWLVDDDLIEGGIGETESYWLSVTDEARKVMLNKNDDYGEVWKDMLPTSLVDEINIKSKRVRNLMQKHYRGEEAKVSEGIMSELRDIINYCVFAHWSWAQETRGESDE